MKKKNHIKCTQRQKHTPKKREKRKNFIRPSTKCTEGGGGDGGEGKKVLHLYHTYINVAHLLYIKTHSTHN